jgi:predicted nucleic acid-binding protein
LADTLLRLAEKGLYRPLWSALILEEAANAVHTIHSEIDTGRIRARFSTMNEAFEDACVENWERLEGSINLPDPSDRHVVAAAVQGRADAILTANLKDFPDVCLTPLALIVQ